MEKNEDEGFSQFSFLKSGIPVSTLEYLSSDDLFAYKSLISYLKQNTRTTSKIRILDQFLLNIGFITDFIHRTKSCIEQRSLICGFGSFGHWICVNNQILKNVLSSSKSSINSYFKQLGYVPDKNKQEQHSHLISIFPSFIVDENSAKQWSLRKNPLKTIYELISDARNKIMQISPRSLQYSLDEIPQNEETLEDSNVEQIDAIQQNHQTLEALDISQLINRTVDSPQRMVQQNPQISNHPSQHSIQTQTIEQNKNSDIIQNSNILEAVDEDLFPQQKAEKKEETNYDIFIPDGWEHNKLT